MYVRFYFRLSYKVSVTVLSIPLVILYPLHLLYVMEEVTNAFSFCQNELVIKHNNCVIIYF